MASIYTRGFTNLIWLGPGTPGCDRIVPVLQSLVDDARRGSDNFSNLVLLTVSRDENFVAPAAGEVELFLRLYEHAWFRRVWGESMLSHTIE